MALTIAQIKTHMLPHEGNVPHMYKDSNGYVTVGIGNKLSNVASAQALPFIVASNRQRATAAQIQADYQAVNNVRGVHGAAYYAPYTSCVLTATDIDLLFGRRVNEFIRQLRALYSDYDSFPDSAQLALLDMAFNLGTGALTRNWPNFNAAVNNADWATAGTQSHRQGIQASRNAGTAALFQQAVTEAAADADAGVP